MVYNLYPLFVFLLLMILIIVLHVLLLLSFNYYSCSFSLQLLVNVFHAHSHENISSHLYMHYFNVGQFSLFQWEPLRFLEWESVFFT
jgi:hypothetical protein